MENPTLYGTLIEHMAREHFPAVAVKRFDTLWHGLKPHEPYPCPNCVAKGARGHLVALPEVGGVEPVQCKACAMVIDLPVPA